jgi:hypothetical protein
VPDHSPPWGSTLAERIVRGPLPIDEALAIARQITRTRRDTTRENSVHRVVLNWTEELKAKVAAK